MTRAWTVSQAHLAIKDLKGSKEPLEYLDPPSDQVIPVLQVFQEPRVLKERGETRGDRLTALRVYPALQDSLDLLDLQDHRGHQRPSPASL